MEGINAIEKAYPGIFQEIEELKRRQLAFCQYRRSGLKALIRLHDTPREPGPGSAGMRDYASEKEAAMNVYAEYPGGYSRHEVDKLVDGIYNALLTINKAEAEEATPEETVIQVAENRIEDRSCQKVF